MIKYINTRVVEVGKDKFIIFGSRERLLEKFGKFFTEAQKETIIKKITES